MALRKRKKTAGHKGTYCAVYIHVSTNIRVSALRSERTFLKKIGFCDGKYRQSFRLLLYDWNVFRFPFRLL
jgi:hypothetical protein